MNQAVITFVGICTHVQNVPLTPPPDAVGGVPLPAGRYHRTIMVNGRLGLRLGKEGMPPHDSLLVIPNEFLDGDPGPIPGLELLPNPDAMVWRMEGASLYVPDAVPGFVKKDGFRTTPSLTEQAKVLSLQLDPRVVVDGRSSGRFDIYAGELDAFIPKDTDAVLAQLTVNTVPAKPQLVVTRIWDETSARITLKDAVIKDVELPPLVFVMNVGKHTDKKIDFLMHYDVTTFTPSPNVVPTPRDLSGVPRLNAKDARYIKYIPAGLTVGCSNSVYP